MNELSAHVAALLYKHLCNEITERESAELLQWRAQSPANENLFIKMQDGEVLKREMQQVLLFNNEAGWAKLLQKIAEKETVKSPKWVIPWIKLLSAAAVFAAVSSSIYWVLMQKNTNIKPSVAKQNTLKIHDKAPGQSGAILIMDNGKQVLLDSMGNGILAAQGNVDLIKKDGQLIYDQGTLAAEIPVYNTMITPNGRQYNLTLSDGTKVWLNSASSMRFPVAFNANERRVEITGEAYFEVAHVNLHNGKGRKPFIVHINKAGMNNGMDVEVLGTHFNVNAYDDEESIKTTLLLGEVNIIQNDKQVKLKPGQQAVYNAEHPIGLKVYNDVDLEKVIGWQNGRFEFDDTELPVIMRQLSRWYDVDIVYEQHPGTENYGGAISKSVQLSDVLRMLEVNGVKFRLEGRKLFVKP